MQTAEEIAREHSYSELAEKLQPSFDEIVDMSILSSWQSRLDAFIREIIHLHRVIILSRSQCPLAYISSVDRCRLLDAPNLGFARNEEPYTMGTNPRNLRCKGCL